LTGVSHDSDIDQAATVADILTDRAAVTAPCPASTEPQLPPR
jgi:hypothetical protein